MKTLDDLLPDIGYIIVEKEAGGNLWLDCKDLKSSLRAEMQSIAIELLKDQGLMLTGDHHDQIID